MANMRFNILSGIYGLQETFKIIHCLQISHLLNKIFTLEHKTHISHNIAEAMFLKYITFSQSNRCYSVFKLTNMHVNNCFLCLGWACASFYDTHKWYTCIFACIFDLRPISQRNKTCNYKQKVCDYKKLLQVHVISISRSFWLCYYNLQFTDSFTILILVKRFVIINFSFHRGQRSTTWKKSL